MTANRNNDRKQRFAISLTGLLLMINACSVPLMHAGPEYYIGFVNKTGRDLAGVCVYYGDIEAANKGYLVKGGRSTEGVITLPIPAGAEVRWIDDGKHHSVKVTLQGVVPKRLTTDWNLYFVINQNGTVQAKAIKDGDEAAFIELTKGLRPDGEYRLGFVNKTGHDIVDVSAYHGEEKLGDAKTIPLRVRQWYSDPLLPPIPPEVEVKWKTDGEPHTVKAKLENIPKGFEGIIYLVMKADSTVEVHPIKKGDDKGAFKVVK